VQNRLREDSKKIRFHEMADGEVAVADSSAVLEMTLDGAVGMIIYDRTLRLAAASKLDLHPGTDTETSISERTCSASRSLLARLITLGCDPDNLEIYALGAVRTEDLAASGLRRVVFALSQAAAGRGQRIEFDVDRGRIVVEGC
jgi:chemotaxis receptor (MCP) glutamine deamidase CheD